MNTIQKQLIYIIVLMNASHLDATTPMIVPRSQSFNTARQIVGWNNPDWGINRKPQESEYTSFNVILEYTRSFDDDHLARSLFGKGLICGEYETPYIYISGSAVADRNNNTDWLADYFGLPRDFQSTVSFKPSISNTILDLSFYASLNAWAQGMYFRIHSPLVHTNWSLNAKECIITRGSANDGSYFQGYFSSVAVPTENLTTSFLNYTNGCTPNIPNNYDLYGEDLCLAGYYPFGPVTRTPSRFWHLTDPAGNGAICTPLGAINWQSLCCSRIQNSCDCDSLTRNGFGEIRAVLGYNFINDADGDYHLGIGLYVAAPTGTQVGDQDDCSDKGRYLFEPIIGNGKHWELGAQATAHYIWWASQDEDKSLRLYVESNITHLFAANQIRCFDLCSAGSNSRYMLAERLHSNRNSLPGLNAMTGAPPGIDPFGLEFDNEYAPVANVTRRNITSSIAVQGDISFSIGYQSHRFQWDIGYNFWGRTCEKIRLQDNCCSLATEQWALKGDQRVYCFLYDIAPPDFTLTARLPVTDSKATITTGSNMRNGVSYVGSNPLEPQNLYADNSLYIANKVTTLPDGSVPIYTSQQPILIQESDFNLAGTRGISNKIFTQLNWGFPDAYDSVWSPYVGIGAEAELGSGDNENHHNHRNDNCNVDRCYAVNTCCQNVAISQWGIWIKVGTSYN